MRELEHKIEELELEVMGLKCHHDQYLAAVVADLKDILSDAILSRSKVECLYFCLGGVL